MEPVKIVDNIYWVGAMDYGIRDFHGYHTYDGSTYNAYLIMDEKITLIDGVKKDLAPELLSRVSQIVDPGKIDCVISNHAEMDHSGALPEIMRAVGFEKPIYCSKMGEKALRAQLHRSEIKYQPVANGETLKLGRYSLQFMETRMVHWPDSMFSFCPEAGILFSQDAFGMHLATSRRFDDEVARNIWGYEALKYMANILTPFTAPIARTLENLESSGLLARVKIICPDHGIIWRSRPADIVDSYKKWVKQEPTRKVVVAYDSMWRSTDYMARALADALTAEGILVRLMDMKKNHRSDVATEFYNSGAILVGSPTMNNEIFPSIAELLCYLRGLKYQNKIGAAFGSYGWSGEAPKLVQAALADMKYTLPVPEVRIQWVPEEHSPEPLLAMAKAVADALPKTPVPPDFGV